MWGGSPRSSEYLLYLSLSELAPRSKQDALGFAQASPPCARGCTAVDGVLSSDWVSYTVETDLSLTGPDL